MKEYTEQEIQEALEKISKMEHYAMCRAWRFAPPGTEILFRSDLPTADAFKERLFKHFGGFTPEISKALGH